MCLVEVQIKAFVVCFSCSDNPFPLFWDSCRCLLCVNSGHKCRWLRQLNIDPVLGHRPRLQSSSAAGYQNEKAVIFDLVFAFFPVSSVSFLRDIFLGIDLKLRLEKGRVGFPSFPRGLHLFRSHPECRRVGNVQEEKEKDGAPWICTHTCRQALWPRAHVC